VIAGVEGIKAGVFIGEFLGQDPKCEAGVGGPPSGQIARARGNPAQ
jgi:hypothetical protein